MNKKNVSPCHGEGVGRAAEARLSPALGDRRESVESTPYRRAALLTTYRQTICRAVIAPPGGLCASAQVDSTERDRLQVGKPHPATPARPAISGTDAPRDAR